jgi:hypothetical protein
MAELQTNFNIAPFYDDYNEDKQYYRILFRPATAVQARELTQIQTILQKQISRFGNSIYKDGTIIEGCGFVRDIFMQIKFKDDSSIAPYITTVPGGFETITFNNTDIANTESDIITNYSNTYLLVSNTSGLRGVVFRAYSGTENAVDNGSLKTNRAYIRYINTGNNAGIPVVQFSQTTEQIDVYNSNQSKIGVLNPTNKIGKLYTLSSNSTVNATGIGYGLHVSPGVVYQKGFFLKTLPQNIIIKEESSNAAGIVVGFDTKEYIVSPVEDESLYDNSIGSTNYNAPGAYRLKLVPEPIYYDTEDPTVVVPTNFLKVLEFDGGDGRLVENNTSPQYSRIMDEMAKRTSEESGDYIVKPFQVDITPHSANNKLFYYNVSSGTGYVDGYRVEFLSPRKMVVPRAYTTNTLSSQIVTTNFGNYIEVKNIAGIFDYNNLASIDIYDQAQEVLSLSQSRTGPSGNKIGTANIRAIKYESGRKGTADGISNFYIFNILMNSGKSFKNEAKSFHANTTTYGKGYADIVTDSYGGANITDSNLAVSVFDTGLPSVKRFTNSVGENNTKFVYKAVLTGSLVPSSGRSTVQFATTGTDIFNYGLGTITDNQSEEIDIIFAQDTYSNAIDTTTTISGSNTTCSNITSSSTITSAFYVGQGISVTNTTTSATTYHTVKEINTGSNIITITPNTSLIGNLTTKKFYKKGTFVDMSGSGNTFTINSSTGATALLELDPSTSAYNMIGLIPVSRNNSTGIGKDVHKNTYVKIDCSNHPNGAIGPWCLGLPDVYSIANVHFGSTYSESNVDKKNWFELDNGQTDAYYGLAKLSFNPAYVGSLTSQSKLLIKLNHFTANITSTKSGFFTVGSYPIDDNSTANINTTIKTPEVPTYTDNSLKTYDLRNAIDMRFFMANTANVAASIATATTNPILNPNTFVKGSSTTQVVPLTEENVIYDVEYYMPRIDTLVITKDGNLDIKFGEPSLKPRTPTINKTGMPIADIFIPPYPSLTFREAE